MWLNPWNKMLAVSLSLAAGGVLACIGAMLQALAPNSTILGSFPKMILVVLAISGLMFALMWIYDRVDDHWIGRLDRRLGAGKKTCGGGAKPAEQPVATETHRRQTAKASIKRDDTTLERAAPELAPVYTMPSARCWLG